jgi:hypothetical protein
MKKRKRGRRRRKVQTNLFACSFLEKVLVKKRQRISKNNISIFFRFPPSSFFDYKKPFLLYFKKFPSFFGKNLI